MPERSRSRKKFQRAGADHAGGRFCDLLFGVCGSLAAKNIRRNPKRFRAITGSIILSVVLGLSLYSFSDFMLLLEAALYGTRALIIALPVCLIIHVMLYSMISTSMTPFVFYIHLPAYGIAILIVALIVLSAMLFSLKNTAKLDLVSQLK